MTAYHLVWRFVTDPAHRAEFETAYSGNGLWADFFGRGEGFLGTELLRDKAGSPTYITVDRWVSREAYQRFRRANAAEYDAIDRRCAELTVEETFLGDAASAEECQRLLAKP